VRDVAAVALTSETAGRGAPDAVAQPVHVMHLVDTLEMGGAERMAVNLVNAMPRGAYRFTLCTTRRDGPLADIVAPDVTRLRLNRSGRFDLAAVGTLARFIKGEHVRILHAHGTSLFLARLAARQSPRPAVVWHDHFGRYAVEERPAWLYRWATAGIDGVIAVNTPLRQWARQRLRVPADRSWYVPNFVMPDQNGSPPLDLPGRPDLRIVCVANLRPQKDHLTLIRAMAQVVKTAPETHLLLAGETPDPLHLERVRAEIARRGLGAHVSILGPRSDVSAIVGACAVGVLSSSSEGLPLALIEYGIGGLAVVATDVGECATVLDGGRAGVLVQPAAADELAGALLRLLASPDLRAKLGRRLQTHVQVAFGKAQGVARVREIYDRVINRL
jgi:glycosyltransferase involved in cell wall biosynthesis